MDNNDIVNQLNNTISAIKTILVSGDDVYTIIAIRNTLNKIISDITSKSGDK